MNRMAKKAVRKFHAGVFVGFIALLLVIWSMAHPAQGAEKKKAAQNVIFLAKRDVPGVLVKVVWPATQWPRTDYGFNRIEVPLKSARGGDWEELEKILPRHRKELKMVVRIELLPDTHKAYQGSSHECAKRLFYCYSLSYFDSAGKRVGGTLQPINAHKVMFHLNDFLRTLPPPEKKYEPSKAKGSVQITKIM